MVRPLSAGKGKRTVLYLVLLAGLEQIGSWRGISVCIHICMQSPFCSGLGGPVPLGSTSFNLIQSRVKVTYSRALGSYITVCTIIMTW